MKRCYNKDASKLDYKDKFIGLIGIEDRKLAENITKGDVGMEDIYKKVEEFSDDEEILGAYDGEWHRQEVARVVMLDKVEQGYKEGHENGREEGIEMIAQNMLKEKVDINFISKVTGLTIDKINNLK
ncbi:MAG: hypothetical protein IJY25_00795 [Bacilli bacterium]|nr:hypothetical protein [Bacilli bacterium]